MSFRHEERRKLWRREDEARLRRLRDEAVFERVWRAALGDAKLPHPRAAGLVAALRTSSEEGARAVDEGELALLLRLVSQPDPSTLTPPLAHHLALFHARVADVLERAKDPARAAAAEHSRVRSIAMWLWLADEGAYLERLAQAVNGGALAEAEVRRIAAEIPYDAIAKLGETARAGARELSERARVALVVLRRVGDAAAMADVSERVRLQAERLAARERSEAIDDALERVAHALDEASTRDETADELVALFADAAAVWRWSGGDEQVERFIVERVTPFCWAQYREKRWDALSALLWPLREPVERLATRIEREPRQLAYAAPCAQIFVFRAQVAPTFETQLALAERAVALCPTHRNGRLVLADLLVERAMRTLDQALPWSTGDALAKAAPDVRRAAQLFPQLKRLPAAKERMKAMGRDVDEP